MGCGKLAEKVLLYMLVLLASRYDFAGAKLKK